MCSSLIAVSSHLIFVLPENGKPACPMVQSTAIAEFWLAYEVKGKVICEPPPALLVKRITELAGGAGTRKHGKWVLPSPKRRGKVDLIAVCL
jgi:hypothetical protein